MMLYTAFSFLYLYQFEVLLLFPYIIYLISNNERYCSRKMHNRNINFWCQLRATWKGPS